MYVSQDLFQVGCECKVGLLKSTAILMPLISPFMCALRHILGWSCSSAGGAENSYGSIRALVQLLFDTKKGCISPSYVSTSELT